MVQLAPGGMNERGAVDRGAALTPPGHTQFELGSDRNREVAADDGSSMIADERRPALRTDSLAFHSHQRDSRAKLKRALSVRGRGRT